MIAVVSVGSLHPALTRRGFFFWGDKANNVNPLQDDAQVIGRRMLAFALGPLDRRLDAGGRLRPVQPWAEQGVNVRPGRFSAHHWPAVPAWPAAP